MFTVMSALALQSMPLLDDRAFLSAHESLVACTDRVSDREAASARGAEEIAAAALAACAAEQEAVRRAVIANAGEASAPELMAAVLSGDREGLADRVRETRRRAAQPPATSTPQAEPSYEAAATALAECQKNYVDAALPAGGRGQDIVDAALRACQAEETLTRAAALRMLGGDQTRTDHFMIEVHTIARNAIRRYVQDRRH